MESKLCLRCARNKLAGNPEEPCADCILLNVDKLAKVRAATTVDLIFHARGADLYQRFLKETI